MTAVDFSAFVQELARVSGEAIMPFFRTAIGAEDKNVGGAFDPVTEADKASELAMRHLIQKTFPHHGILGEEFGIINPDAEYCWVLDPIDGTRSFISGVPLWGTLIGLTHKGKPVYGMMHQPFTRERFVGDGSAATWSHEVAGRRTERNLRARGCATLAQATLMTTSPRIFTPERLAAYDRVEAQVRLARYGADCYAYCLLASGHVDLVIEAGLKPYDIVALIPVIEGAGGIVTTWDGGDASHGGTIIAAGDRRIHKAALKLLAG
ncbi:histidinol-phosphatase [Methylovirgula sp. 4M-Z18]|uniref:histidinol-phosphatase n=1 Tax=Methylovirgula sp. 4M-Z18 TaxID=2293567 RepID=UPI000E2EEAD1|nr:histidinol-phosphatase [Methylovirgula sp. 4M-Z18]RFB78286.1 histidinol-phosphatase [Methylovirgula sp. 4M-Z18]